MTSVPMVKERSIDRLLQRQCADRLQGIFEGRDFSPSAVRFVRDVARIRFGRDILAALEDADLVIFQAEGTMTGAGFGVGLRLLLLPWLAKALGKPLVAMNQTLFSQSEPFIGAVRGVLGAAEFLSVREPASLDWAKASGLDRCRLVPDAAFMEPVSVPQPEDRFGVTGTAMSERFSTDIYLDVVASVARRTGLRPLFFCSTNADLKIVEAGRDRFPESQALPVETDPAEVAAAMARCRFLMGGRYHMAILAALSATPTLILSTNTHKNLGLRRLFGCGPPVLAFPGDGETLPARAEELLRQETALRSKLGQRVDTIRAFLHDFGRDLRGNLSAVSSGNAFEMAKDFAPLLGDSGEAPVGKWGVHEIAIRTRPDARSKRTPFPFWWRLAGPFRKSIDLRHERL
jgi:polysaccharide pyruvyl transferase WcaK-like protein